MKSTKRLMKSEKEIKKICEQEVTKMYENISRDVAYHTFAMCFLILNREFGFGRKRLHELKDLIESEYWKMQASPLGIKYDSDDVMRTVKERFGIDFSESQYGGES